ncbi:MAG: hypothetical protein WDZ40_01505 [Candidatus Spechtbacterales bacterium]
MAMQKLKKYLKHQKSAIVVSVFWGLVVLMFGFTFHTFAAWNPPTASPPADNTPTPLNATGVTQYKSGGLGVGGVFETDIDAYFGVTSGGVAIGSGYSGSTPPGSGLIVEGTIGIGTSSPDMPLHLRSQANELSSGIRLSASDYITNGGYVIFNKNDSTGRALIQSGDSATWRELAFNPYGGLVTIGSGGLVVGGGTGKITAGVFDPVYSIGGTKYATYAAGMIGLKEEHTDVINLEYDESSGLYRAILDFENAQEGSDLWLFSKTTNLDKNFQSLAVLLTTSFRGDVWYEKDKENMRVTVYAEKAGEVSYRLTAPRFDFEQWTNYAKDAEGIDGFIID